MSDFTESLLGCFNDLKSCVCVTFVPCGAACTQGWAVAASNPMEPQCFAPCMCNLYLCCIGATINRGKIRKNFGYDEKCLLDFAVHFFCMPCGICQEARETQKQIVKNVTAGMEGAMKQASEQTPLNQ